MARGWFLQELWHFSDSHRCLTHWCHTSCHYCPPARGFRPDQAVPRPGISRQSPQTLKSETPIAGGSSKKNLWFFQILSMNKYDKIMGKLNTYIGKYEHINESCLCKSILEVHQETLQHMGNCTNMEPKTEGLEPMISHLKEVMMQLSQSCVLKIQQQRPNEFLYKCLIFVFVSRKFEGLAFWHPAENAMICNRLDMSTKVAVNSQITQFRFQTWQIHPGLSFIKVVCMWCQVSLGRLGGDPLHCLRFSIYGSFIHGTSLDVYTQTLAERNAHKQVAATQKTKQKKTDSSLKTHLWGWNKSTKISIEISVVYRFPLDDVLQASCCRPWCWTWKQSTDWTGDDDDDDG